jgi:hypothetical protein
MRIPNFPKLTREEFQDAPEWFDRLSNVLNAHMDKLTIALQGNVGIDNKNQELLELEVRKDKTYELTAKKVKGNIIGVSKIYDTSGDTTFRLVATILDKNKISIRCLWDDPEDTCTVRLILHGV